MHQIGVGSAVSRSANCEAVRFFGLMRRMALSSFTDCQFPEPSRQDAFATSIVSIDGATSSWIAIRRARFSRFSIDVQMVLPMGDCFQPSSDSIRLKVSQRTAKVTRSACMPICSASARTLATASAVPSTIPHSGPARRDCPGRIIKSGPSCQRRMMPRAGMPYGSRS